MAKMIQCDQCEKREPVGTLGWFRLEAEGEPEYGNVAQEDCPVHFCSATCAAKWLEVNGAARR